MALRQAFQRAMDRGVIVVTSAGNDHLDTDSSVHFPGTLPGMISVGAVGEELNLASFSNFGPHSVAFLAPGSNILSSLRDGQMGMMSGTSMASPMVASAAAWILGLVKVKYPEWDMRQRRDKVLQLLCDSARKEGEFAARSRCGLVQVDRATQLLLEMPSDGE